jgi:hypothetical protein
MTTANSRELAGWASLLPRALCELNLSGLRVEGPEAAELIWVTDASGPSGLPALTYADLADNEVWVGERPVAPS